LNRDLPDLSTPSMAEVTADSSAYMVSSYVAATGELATNSGSFGGSAPNARNDKATAVGAALTANRIMGNYITSEDYGTEWIVTFPTRYTKVSDSGADAPFMTVETASSGQACHNSTIDHWDRNGTGGNVDMGFILPPNHITFCYAVNVKQFNGVLNDFTEVTSSKAAGVARGLDFEDGWGSIDLSFYTVTPTVFTAGDSSGDVRGLPLIGFAAVADAVSGTERGGVFPLRIAVDEQ
jgi:hypothetical protein